MEVLILNRSSSPLDSKSLLVFRRTRQRLPLSRIVPARTNSGSAMLMARTPCSLPRSESGPPELHAGRLTERPSRLIREANIYLIDPNRGVPRKLNITNIHGNNLPSWSRDGKWIYFVNGEDAHKPSVWKVSYDGGEAVQIVASPATYPIEATDASYLHFLRNPVLWRSHLDGSGQEEVPGMPPLKRLGDKWVAHSSGIYFLTNEQNKAALEFFDASTKKTRRITELEGIPPGWMGQMSVSSDGTWLVYPQVEASSSNLMMIENWQ